MLCTTPLVVKKGVLQHKQPINCSNNNNNNNKYPLYSRTFHCFYCRTSPILTTIFTIRGRLIGGKKKHESQDSKGVVPVYLIVPLIPATPQNHSHHTLRNKQTKKPPLTLLLLTLALAFPASLDLTGPPSQAPLSAQRLLQQAGDQDSSRCLLK